MTALNTQPGTISFYQVSPAAHLYKHPLERAHPNITTELLTYTQTPRRACIFCYCSSVACIDGCDFISDRLYKMMCSDITIIIKDLEICSLFWGELCVIYHIQAFNDFTLLLLFHMQICQKQHAHTNRSPVIYMHSSTYKLSSHVLKINAPTLHRVSICPGPPTCVPMFCYPSIKRWSVERFITN